MVLDAATESHLDRVVAEARSAFGDDLVSVLLYGSAAGEDFVAGRSDLNLAIVVTRATFAHLQSLASCLPRWHRWGVATPLFVDRAFLDGAADVFAMEILDIQAEHRLLYGADVFAGLVPERSGLRHQIEYEARAKLLRLRVQFAEAGGKRARLQALMVDSLTSFAALMRALLRWHGAPAPGSLLALIDAFEKTMRVRLPAVREIAQVRRSSGGWSQDATAVFSAYLAEVERFVEFADMPSLAEIDAPNRS